MQKNDQTKVQTNGLGDDVKMEEEYSSMSQKKKRGRPKKNPQINSQTAEAQLKSVKKKKQKKSQKSQKQVSQQQKEANKVKQPKIEDTSSTTSRKRRSRKPTPKPQDPNENDLCQALMILRTKLPNRSLEKIIIRLFETVEEKQKNKQDICSKTQFDGRTQRDFDQSVYSFKGEQNVQKEDEKQRNFDQISVDSKQTGIKENNSKFSKLAIPGRKVSCYHDTAGEAAALSHQFYKNNTPSLQNLQNMERNMAKTCLSTKHKGEGSSIEQKNEYKDEVVLYFKQSQTLRTMFYNPQEEQRYRQRRQLTRLFVERGYGITKAIDNDLPKINIDREKYKNLLGGVLTMAFRKLQSFLTNEFKRTIKYLDREQMKSTSYMLLNCRVKLQPSVCQTFYKVLRICFGLGNVALPQSEAVQLYVGAMKHLYGRNITMQACENMGRIKNRRDMQNTIQTLKQSAKAKGKGSQSMSSYTQKISIYDKKPKDLLKTETNMEPFLYGLATNYIGIKDINTVREILVKKHKEYLGVQNEYLQSKLNELMQQGIHKVQYQNLTNLPSGPFLLKLSDWHIQEIKELRQDEIRSLIISYLFTEDPSLLKHCIEQINTFVADLNINENEQTHQFSQFPQMLSLIDDPQYLQYNPLIDDFDDSIDPLLQGFEDEDNIQFD